MMERNAYRFEGRRHDFSPPAPAVWAEKSAAILSKRKWTDLRVKTRADVGLVVPIRSTDLRAYLESLVHPRLSVEAEPRDYLIIWAAEWDWSVGYWPNCDSELARLDTASEQLMKGLDLTRTDALCFLLTDEAVGLPWLSIETITNEEITGGGMWIHLGSIAVTAEQVREAIVTAKRDILGVRSARQMDLDDIALVRHDEAARFGGLNWRETWEAWQAKADTLGELSANRYGSEAAYRNKINDLARRFEWARRQLDHAPGRQAGRPRGGAGDE